MILMGTVLLFCLLVWAVLLPAIVAAWHMSPMLALAIIITPIAILLDLLARVPRHK